MHWSFAILDQFSGVLTGSSLLTRSVKLKKLGSLLKRRWIGTGPELSRRHSGSIQHENLGEKLASAGVAQPPIQ